MADRRRQVQGVSPRFVAPMQARLVSRLPEGDDWLYEVKCDGYRAIAKNGDHVAILSRNNKDLTSAYPTVCAAINRLPVDAAVLDGEVVAVDASGRSPWSSSTGTTS